MRSSESLIITKMEKKIEKLQAVVVNQRTPMFRCKMILHIHQCVRSINLISLNGT